MAVAAIHASAVASLRPAASLSLLRLAEMFTSSGVGQDYSVLLKILSEFAFSPISPFPFICSEQHFFPCLERNNCPLALHLLLIEPRPRISITD